MNYDIFLGCVIPARLPFLEASARKIFNKLGIGLNNIEGFSCCPDPTGIELVSRKAWLALGARNLSLSRSKDGILSLCSGCVKTLKSVNHEINKKHGKREINEMLGKIGKTYDLIRIGLIIRYLQNVGPLRNVEEPISGKPYLRWGC